MRYLNEIDADAKKIIDEIFVEAGDFIDSGDLIAKVKVVPNISSLNSAKNNINSISTQVETARLAFQNQENIKATARWLFLCLYGAKRSMCQTPFWLL